MPTQKELANAIRVLAMDGVQKANSGHPGAPMGMADIAEVLWRGFLKHNPQNPKWADRDRFVLSNGHGSMLIYSLLHLTGYDLSIEDLKNFILAKLEELALACNKKFADRNETANNLKYLEDQIRKLFELLSASKKDTINEADN